LPRYIIEEGILTAMITRLNGYILTDKVNEDMRKALYKSRQIEKEVGLTMCSNKDNVISLRGEHDDSVHKISIRRQCNTEEEYVGYYHTHPGSDSHASSVDLRSCGTSKILCVGGKAEQKGQEEQINDNARCYTWKDKVISVEEGEKLFIDVSKGRKEHINPEHIPHFNCLNTIGRYALDQEILDSELETIGFAPLRRLPIMLKFQELNMKVEEEVDKYYNITKMKLIEDQ
jgi:proteasome lid subunit RPN8/RPN11